MKLTAKYLPREKKLGGQTLRIKRVHDASGKLVTLRAIDADSEDFGRALGGVFQRNVVKARKTAAKLSRGKRGKAAAH